MLPTPSASHRDTNRHLQWEVAVLRVLILELPDSLCKTQGFFIDHKSFKASKKETTLCTQAYLSSLRFHALMRTLTTARLQHISPHCVPVRHRRATICILQTENWNTEGGSRQADLLQTQHLLCKFSCPESHDLVLSWLPPATSSSRRAQSTGLCEMRFHT